MAEYLSKEELEDWFDRPYYTIYEMFNFGPDDYIQHWYKDEIWCEIEEFQGYWISNKGRVWSDKSKMLLKHFTDTKGYKFAVFTHNTIHYNRRIHNLIATYFIPNPEQCLEALHWDDRRNNNTVSNLRWGTHSDNMKDMVRNGNHFGGWEYRNPPKPIIVTEIISGKETIYESGREACRELNINQGNMANALKRNGTSHGYRFRYAEESEAI